MTNAFLFPGQGSQSVGMATDLGEHHAVVRATFDEASEVIGDDLWQLVAEGPADTLNQTVWTQPAMLAAGVATYRAWREGGGAQPETMAGHSLGEYSALVCANALSFVDAVSLIARRAELMQGAVAPDASAMVAVIGMTDEQVSEICALVADGEIVEPVNFNAPGQVVVTGDKSAVERFAERATTDGARRVISLSVSVPSHSSLMRPAAQQFEKALADVSFTPAEVTVIHNAGPVDPRDADSVRAALARQLYSPVPWSATVQGLLDGGTDRFYECGPGRVLSGLVKRIFRRATVLSLHDTAALAEALQQSNEVECS